MWGLALFGILFYRIGRSFFRLALSHGKNAWGYAIWGVASYFVGLLLALLLISIVLVVLPEPESKDNYKSAVIIGSTGILLGFVACWFNYRYLRNKWGNKKVIVSFDLLDENF